MMGEAIKLLMLFENLHGGAQGRILHVTGK
jgi:hypothetical protein